MLYLNQAGTSWPKPPPVRDAVREALVAPPETWSDRLAEDHRALCDALGVTDPERLLLTPGATSALSVGILDHPWQPGDRVLVSGLEHHALHRPVQQLLERGVGVEVIPPGEGGPLALGALRRELGGGGIRLVAVTAASNVTGDLLPVSEIIAMAHEHDALVAVDAAQIAGWIPIDVRTLDVDLLAFTGHKGPQGPWGIGGLYVSGRVRMSSPAAACEIPAPGETRACADMPGYCDVGSVDRAALAGLAAGLRWLAAPERAGRLQQARDRTMRLQQSLEEMPGVTVHAFHAPAERMPIVAVTAADRSPAELASGLLERGVIASGGLQCAPLAHRTLGTEPEGVLRLSFGPGNAEGDEETAIRALQGVFG